MVTSTKSARAPAAHVRKLCRDDAEQFSRLYLNGLRRHPEAFAAAYEDESQLSAQEFAAKLEREETFGAFDEERLIGILTLQPYQVRKRAHVAMIWGLYVDPAHRGAGAARLLMQEVMDHAARQVDQVELYVESRNERAIALYQRLGFEQYGLMRRSLRVNGRDHDAVMMVRIFR